MSYRRTQERTHSMKATDEQGILRKVSIMQYSKPINIQHYQERKKRTSN